MNKPFDELVPREVLALPVGIFYTVADVVRSQTAQRQNIDNLLPFSGQHYANACATAERLLEPLHSRFGMQPHISSWFRCPALNRAIGGAENSDHKEGRAVDFTVPGRSLIEVYNFIAFESGLPFDQVIFEFGSWLHVSYNRQRTRGQRLRIDKGGGGYKRVLKPIN